MVVAFSRWGAGIRFPNVTIPQGATINSANISLDRFAGGDGHSHPNVTIAAEDVDNASTIKEGCTYSGAGFNISERWNRRTSATTLWYEDVNEYGRSSTPDLSFLVQEIVDRPGWQSGNAIMFIFKCEPGSNYESYSWDIGDDTYRPVLYINYTSELDTTPPIRSNGQPNGTLPAGTTNTTLSLTTNEAATCKYSTSSGTPYSSMTNVFSTTGETFHSDLVTGLTDGNNYNYYIRCNDTSGNVNTNDYIINFSIGTTTICTDNDGDGYNVTGNGCGPVDCNDTNESIHPGAFEFCNGIDDDCDTLTDENYPDTDNDGLKDCVDPDDDNDNCPDAEDYNINISCPKNSCSSLTNGCDNNCTPITCSGTNSSCGCSAGTCTICESGAHHCINNACELITEVFIHPTYQQVNDSVIINGTNITIKSIIEYTGSGSKDVNIPIPNEWISDGFNWMIDESGFIKIPTRISNNLTWNANLSSTSNSLIFETYPPHIQDELPEIENETHYNNSFTVKSSHNFTNVSIQIPINPIYSSWPLSNWTLIWYNNNTNTWESKKQDFNLQIHINYISFYGFNTSDQMFILSGSNETCLPDWICTQWSQCSGGQQSCLSWIDNNNCSVPYTGQNTRSCSTPSPSPSPPPSPPTYQPQPNCTGNQTKPCGSNVGLCKAGTRYCINGSWRNCVGEVGPTDEICNGIDDDCNGLTDDRITCQCNNSATKTCGSNIGICKQGMMTCINGMWTECIGIKNPNDQEICSNSLDDNCNGETDEPNCLSIGPDIQICANGQIPLKGCICGENTYTSGYCCKNTHQLNPCEQTKIPYVEIFLAGIMLMIIALLLYSRKQEVISKVKGTPIEMDKQIQANSITLKIKNKTNRVLRNITVYDSVSKGDFLDSQIPPSIETFIDIDNLKWKFSELNPNQELVINYTTKKPQDLKYSKSFVIWIEGKEYRFSK